GCSDPGHHPARPVLSLVWRPDAPCESLRRPRVPGPFCFSRYRAAGAKASGSRVMSSLTKVTIPTTETVAKDVPDVERDDIPLPSDPNTVLLTGLFVFALLACAYFAAEVVLP